MRNNLVDNEEKVFHFYIIKFLKQELNEIHYYIPCYNIGKNEIYFMDFFTEEIITKPKEIEKKIFQIINEKLNSSKLKEHKTEIDTSTKNNKLTDEEKKKFQREKIEKKCLLKFQLKEYNCKF